MGIGGLILVGILVTVVLFLVLYALILRRWVLTWGTSQADLQRSLPGDDLIPQAKSISTHAITIKAPVADVWPWLVQIGHKRAGWYSYDAIHRILGVAGSVDDPRASANRIIPELQHLAVGDDLEIGPGMGYQVVDVEPGRYFVLHISLDQTTWQSFDPADGVPTRYLHSSWVWFLDEADQNRTRLIVRINQDYNPSLMNALMIRGLIEPGSFIMERKTMLGIKRRAEA